MNTQKISVIASILWGITIAYACMAYHLPFFWAVISAGLFYLACRATFAIAGRQ